MSDARPNWRRRERQKEITSENPKQICRAEAVRWPRLRFTPLPRRGGACRMRRPSGGYSHPRGNASRHCNPDHRRGDSDSASYGGAIGERSAIADYPAPANCRAHGYHRAITHGH
jgi:hypothetical protein